MTKKPLDIAGFLKLVIEALNAAGVEYLIGGAIAEWAWGEPRATQDLDLVVKIPIKSINKLSKELEKETCSFLPRSSWIISWKTGQISRSMPSTCTAVSKPICIRCGKGMSFGKVHFNGGEQVDYGPPIGKVYIHSPEDLILYKLMYFGLSQQSKHSRDIAAILKVKEK